MWSLAALIVVTVLYFVQFVVFLAQRDWQGAIILFGYAFANIGFLWKWRT